MIMARYRVDAKLELSGGVRANRWSGAYAKFLQSATDNPAGFDIWNNPFNVDWSQDLGGGVYKGYSARSIDVVLGARYQDHGKAGRLHRHGLSRHRGHRQPDRNAASRTGPRSTRSA